MPATRRARAEPTPRLSSARAPEPRRGRGGSDRCARARLPGSARFRTPTRNPESRGRNPRVTVPGQFPVMPVAALPICACGCGEQLPPPPATGRPRRFVNDAHRKRAARSRATSPSWGGPMAAGPPADPETRRRRTLQQLADYLGGQPAAPPEHQLAQLILELGQALFTLRQLAPRVHQKLGARSAQLARDLDDALRRSFGEVL